MLSGSGCPHTPLQHWRPHASGTDCIYPNRELCIVCRHSLGQRDHRAFGGDVSGVILLPDESDHACRIENNSLAGDKSFKGVTRRPIYRLDIRPLQRIPLFFAGLMQGLRRAGDAGIVMDCIDAPKFLDDRRQCGLNRCSVRYVREKPKLAPPRSAAVRCAVSRLLSKIATLPPSRE